MDIGTPKDLLAFSLTLVSLMGTIIVALFWLLIKEKDAHRKDVQDEKDARLADVQEANQHLNEQGNKFREALDATINFVKNFKNGNH